ncbi:hypothetical protein [Streptomyces sp. NBC_00842]|uniref:hypothetical protein n=1 Tax=Streptomyces sp. NBC_00842 TaxID=2975848 RepID=UPI00386F5CA8|nr:hypothetical protein OH821_38740 [Streptomyces sp. NBC_00842]
MTGRRAEQMADLATGLRWHLSTDELADLLPSPDDVVHACLNALPEAGPAPLTPSQAPAQLLCTDPGAAPRPASSPRA